jgi:CheY-like chemotaxis protein
LIRVLHVDDEPERSKLLKRLLEESGQGLKIESVTSPEDVPRMLRLRVFDCVISDYEMPGMDGVELGKMVKEIADIPFIVYTDRGNEEVAAEAISAGLDMYVLKMADPEHNRSLATRLTIAVKAKREEERREISLKILRILSRHGGLQESLGEILRILRDHLDVEAVGIRLQEGDNYPYFVFNGFHDEHILLENSLCAFDLEGQLMRDGGGNPVHECMCGNILHGRFDPSKPFFTEGGSFWTNSTTGLLRSTSVEDRMASTRDTCNAEGYESVALIPIRNGGETLGLLQLNDSRTGAFDEGAIDFLEGLGRIIGVVLSKIYRERETRESMERYMGIFNSVPHPTFIVDPDDYAIIQANDIALEYANTGRREIKGMSCHRVITGRDMPCDFNGETCPILQMLEEGKMNVTTLHSWIGENGSKAYVEESVSPIRDEEGFIDMVVLVARYLTKMEVT